MNFYDTSFYLYVDFFIYIFFHYFIIFIISNPPKESYFSIKNSISRKFDVEIDLDMTNKSIDEIIAKIVDEHLIAKLRELINKTGSHLYDNRAKKELKLILTVCFVLY